MKKTVGMERMKKRMGVNRIKGMKRKEAMKESGN